MRVPSRHRLFLHEQPRISDACCLRLGFALAASCGMVSQTNGLAKAVLAFSLVLAVVQASHHAGGCGARAAAVGLHRDGQPACGAHHHRSPCRCGYPAVLVFYVTKMNDFTNAAVKVLHVPYKYAFAFTSTVRFIPVFMNDMAGIMEAQTARGVEFDGSLPKKIRLMMSLCVPLLVSSVRKTNSAAIAAEVRGFNLRTRESGYKEYPFAFRDVAALVATAAVLACALALNLLG